MVRKGREQMSSYFGGGGGGAALGAAAASAGIEHQFLEHRLALETESNHK